MKTFFQHRLYLPTIFFISVLLGLSAPQTSFGASYCEPKYQYSSQYMGIDNVEVGDMTNSSDWASSPGYTYFDSKTVNVTPGDLVYFTVDFGYTYPMELAIYIDWNGDGEFDIDTELAYGSLGEFSDAGYSDKFTVPAGATIGTTRMRVMTEYSYMEYQYPSDPCGTFYYYGEAEDYNFNIAPASPDASITSLNSPTTPFRVGNFNVNVTLSSNNKTVMKSAFIDWWLNGVPQTTYSWTGSLTENKTTNLTLGSVNLDYPDGSNYDPFTFKFQVRNANGFDEDSDPSNDVLNVSMSPILNDVGVVGFFGPPEGFGPGFTQVRARVRNYAPKPLTSVTIDWKIDGVPQTPVTISGLNILRDQTQDLILGTYNFYAKTPLGPFTVECVSSKPNGVTDEDQSNDTYNGGIGPSLAAGVYTIGGSAAHFASPSEAASYINSSGVFGEGKVTFRINPGFYNGQVILNSPLPRKNPIEFIGNSQYPTDIIIAYTPNAQNNFVVLLDGLDNISFSNMMFRNNSNNISNAGTIIDAKRVSGLEFKNIQFLGITNSPRTNQYAIMNLLNCTGVNIAGNAFNNGSIGVLSNITMSINPVIDINHNDFYNFTWLGVYNNIDPYAMPVGHVSISDNNFIGNSSLAPTGGISSWNSSVINNNVISGIVGTGAANGAVIYVNHTNQNPDETAEIVSNRISAINTNGIFVDGAHTFVNRNYVNVAQSANYGLASFRANNASGAAGNNQFVGSSMNAVNITSSPSFDFLYNSVASESNSLATAKIYNAGQVLRNVFYNKGFGVALEVGSMTNSNQNVFFTNGNALVNDQGVNLSNLSDWQAKGFDSQSKFANIEFESLNDLHIKFYNAALLGLSPLFDGETGFANLIEQADFDGNNRLSYFVGSHELRLSIIIERQTDGFADCEGTTHNLLSVSSAIDFNAPMTYQWELDNKPIDGATEPILFFKNLNHVQAGIYRCLVQGPGATQPVYSMDVSVYVLRPTDITRETKSVTVFTGEVATLSFDAHVNGKSIETAIANDEVQVRWYKYIDETNSILINDNNLIAGAKSNYLTFRNFSASNEGTYFASIVGICGEVKTAHAYIGEENLEIQIARQPVEKTACENADVVLSVDATTKSSIKLTYQWFKNGVAIADAKTNTLNITSLEKADAGSYYVVIALDGTGISEQSNTVLVNVRTSPEIVLDLKEATVATGKQLVLEIIAEGEYDGVSLVYKWYHNGTLVQDSEDSYYIVEASTADDAGDYYVIVENQCGGTQSATAVVTITTGTTSVIEVSKNGYSLSTATPNPVQTSSIISFVVPTESYVKISLSDVTGAGITTIAEGNYSAGNYSVNFSAIDNNLSSGTYFYFLEANGVRLSQRMVVVR